jgi:hypothetical protein
MLNHRILWICSDDDHTVGEVVRIATPRLQEIGINPSLFSRHADQDLNDLTSIHHFDHLWLNMFTMVTPAYSLN